MTEQPYSIEDQNKLAAKEQEAARIKASQDFGRLDRLKNNEDWQWFMETHVRPIVERELIACRRLADGKDKVWDAANRRAVAEEIEEKLSLEHERASRAALINPAA